MLHELGRAGFEPLSVRVDTRPAYLQRLAEQPFEIVLSDYSLPQFDGLRALRDLRAAGHDIPFIVVTAAISEEVAVECIKEGAADYLLKDRLSRLGSAVERALADKRLRDEKREAEAALRRSEARYRAVSELTSDYAYALRLAPDRMRFEWVTEAFGRITGYSLEALQAAGGWQTVVYPDDREMVGRFFEILQAGDADVCEYRIVTLAGEVRQLRDHGRPAADQDAGGDTLVYGAAQDITETKRAEEALKRRALYDTLTDLPNRTLFRDRLERAILNAARDEQSLALLIMDLDRFKEINDTLGHHSGDILLQLVADRLRTALRQSDTVARLGGDEFAVILPDAQSADEALRVATKLLDALDLPMVLEGHQLSVGASVGIAMYPGHGNSPETLLRRADVAMYVAKRGRTGFAVYDAEHDRHALSRLSLMSDLRTAIEQRELILYYQPKVQLETARVTSVEALVRWPHAQHGLILPDQFVPMAEQTGLIRPLSHLVLNLALEQAARWQHCNLALPVAVNLSMLNMLDADMPDTIAELLGAWGANPASLIIEITESTLMANPARARQTIQRIRSMGSQIAIDDFGTGYSSLAYLKNLPVDELKVDRSFVKDMADNRYDAAIVRSTIELGHNLGITVVAEGVEDGRTWRLLRDLGCDLAQGHYLGRPWPAKQLFGGELESLRAAG